MRDNVSNLQMVFLGTVTVSGATPAVSPYVDRLGFRSATLVVKTNTVTDAGDASGFTVTAQSSVDTTAAAAANLTADDTIGGSAAVIVTPDTDDNKIVGEIGLRDSVERYLGVTVTGSTNSNATFDVYAVLGHPEVAPTTFIGTAVART